LRQNIFYVNKVFYATKKKLYTKFSFYAKLIFLLQHFFTTNNGVKDVGVKTFGVKMCLISFGRFYILIFLEISKIPHWKFRYRFFFFLANFKCLNNNKFKIFKRKENIKKCNPNCNTNKMFFLQFWLVKIFEYCSFGPLFYCEICKNNWRGC